MGLAQYSIVPIEAFWTVLHDGALEGHFETKEAAFEAARDGRGLAGMTQMPFAGQDGAVAAVAQQFRHLWAA